MSLDLSVEQVQGLGGKLPLLLTPGAAEAIAVKAYRLSKTQSLAPMAALDTCLIGYQAPVPEGVLKFQMQIAVREATDLAFVPESLRGLANEGAAGALA
jgi:hypothetical protein